MEIIKKAKERNREIYIYMRAGRPLLSLSLSLARRKLFLSSSVLPPLSRGGNSSSLSLALPFSPLSSSLTLSSLFSIFPSHSPLSRTRACVRKGRGRFLPHSLSSLPPDSVSSPSSLSQPLFFLSFSSPRMRARIRKRGRFPLFFFFFFFTHSLSLHFSIFRDLPPLLSPPISLSSSFSFILFFLSHNLSLLSLLLRSLSLAVFPLSLVLSLFPEVIPLSFAFLSSLSRAPLSGDGNFSVARRVSLFPFFHFLSPLRSSLSPSFLSPHSLFLSSFSSPSFSLILSLPLILSSLSLPSLPPSCDENFPVARRGGRSFFFLSLFRHDNSFCRREREMKGERIEWRRERRESENV